MLTHSGLIVNADDLGLSESVNKAILLCYNEGYINSSSIITNTPLFDKTVQLINDNPIIRNIGIHINFAGGKPLTSFNHPQFLNKNGEWDLKKTQKYSNSFSNEVRDDFQLELYAQIDKALSAGIKVSHIDSHYHLHILPCFFNLFIQAAKKYNLKLRLSQISHEQNLIKYLYRSYINNKIRSNNCNYLDNFENLKEFLKKFPNEINQDTELMVHPDLNEDGSLTDSVDDTGFKQWIEYAVQPSHNLNSTV